jgi:hypothetical protein
MALGLPREVRRCMGRKRCWLPMFAAAMVLVGFQPRLFGLSADNELSVAERSVVSQIEGSMQLGGDGENKHQPLPMQQRAQALQQPRSPPQPQPPQQQPLQPPTESPLPLLPPPPPALAEIPPLTTELMGSMDADAKLVYATSLNRHQEVMNSHLLPEPLGNSPIIVVMVHNRPLYLKAVLRSLSAVQGIESTLLVISLDYLSPEMDAIVRGVKFCAVRSHSDFSSVVQAQCHD